MKTLIILVLSSFILACNANKNVTKDNDLVEVNSICPENGTCTFEVLKNKNFNMKVDNFGNPYSELVDGSKTVLKFEYIKKTTPEVQDDNYSEVIYIEIDNEIDTIELNDQALQTVKAGFSRICYCKGQTGTYPIKTGSLSIVKHKNNGYHLKFDFTISEVPQIINSISESFEL